MSDATDTPESLSEDDTPSTAVNTSRTVTDSELITLAQQAQAQVQSAGARPTFGAPGLRIRDQLTHPSLSLQAANIQAIEGYDDDTKGFVLEALTAMDTLHQGVEQIISAREASKRNPSWTEGAQVLHVADLADKVQTRAARLVDSTLASLQRKIDGFEQELRKPIEAGASTALAAEVRAHAKSLPLPARNKLVMDLISKNDQRSLGALLGAPPFLSGLDDAAVAVYTEQFNRTRQPALARRVAVMKTAHEMLSNAGSLFIVQVEAAQGVNGHVVAKLKAAKTNAEKAFIVQG
jgi:hypothetical protein